MVHLHISIVSANPSLCEFVCVSGRIKIGFKEYEETVCW